METQPELSIAQGRYELHSALGEGGMAYVFRCTDTRLKVDRAVKFLAPRLMRHSQIRERFESEASTMALLNHPNIVQIFDIGNEKSLVYMVMELLDGGSVQDRIERHGLLEPVQAINVAIAMAKGLGFAHRNNVIHRDVKLDNVLISKDGIPKVADFGIARINDGRSGMTMTGAVMGTLAYMAPEQRLSARRAGPQADLYAVAASFYVMLSGENPSELFSEEIQAEAFKNFSQPIQEFLRVGCSYSPEHRFANAEDMITALEQLKETVAPLSEEHTPLWVSVDERSSTSMNQNRTETLNTMWVSLISEDSSGAFQKETKTDATMDGFFPVFENADDLHTMETLVPEVSTVSVDSKHVHPANATGNDAALGDANIKQEEGDLPISSSKRNIVAPYILVFLVLLFVVGGYSVLASKNIQDDTADQRNNNDEFSKSKQSETLQNTPQKINPTKLEGAPYDNESSNADPLPKSQKITKTNTASSPARDAPNSNPTTKQTKAPRKNNSPPGNVVINSRPFSKITINGKSKGAPYLGELPAGSYRVKFEAEGFAPHRQKITVRSGSTTNICYSFKNSGPCDRDF